jgi:RNA polymerase sigma factor (sigma-70 family)
VKNNFPEPNSAPLPEERRLVQSAESGDSEAFARLLYDAYLERMYRCIYFRISDAVAEDITSQVFLKAWENLERYEFINSPFVAWLYTIARNQVIDHCRTNKELVSMDEIVSSPAKENAVVEQIRRRDLRFANASIVNIHFSIKPQSVDVKLKRPMGVRHCSSVTRSILSAETA